MRPFFLFSNAIIRERNASNLRIETACGRSVILLMMAGLLSLVMPETKYACLILCVIIWSYKREWIFDKAGAEIRREQSILWMLFDERALAMSEVRMVSIGDAANADAVGSHPRVSIKMKSGKNQQIADVGSRARALEVVKAIIPYLPESVTYDLAKPEM